MTNEHTPRTVRGWLKRWLGMLGDSIVENPWEFLALGGNTAVKAAIIAFLIAWTAVGWAYAQLLAG